jgi:hypothetical protein
MTSWLSDAIANTNFIVFDLPDWGSNPPSTALETKHADHYPTDVVLIIKKKAVKHKHQIVKCYLAIVRSSMS